jgi:drug/metabolite transporter (DMT)-like permease
MTRLALVTGVLCISFAPIFVRLAETDPATVAFYRMLFALPVLGALWAMRRRRDRRPAWARWLACFAGLFLGTELVLWHYSIEYIGAGVATLLGNTQVVFVGIVAWLVYRERPTATALTVLPAVLAGIVLLSGLGAADAYGENPAAGAVLGMATAIGYSVFLLVFRHSNRGFLAPSAGPLLDATAGAALAALIAVLIESGVPPAPTWPSAGWILALALVVQTFSWLLIGFTLPRVPALEASVVLLLQPVGAIIWAHLIFDERLSVVQWIGAGIVLVGIFILGSSGSAKQKPSPVSPVRPG